MQSLRDSLSNIVEFKDYNMAFQDLKNRRR